MECFEKGTLKSTVLCQYSPRDSNKNKQTQSGEVVA